MSEAAPGYPDAEQFATGERARLAAALRRLIDASMRSSRASGAELLDAARVVDRLATNLLGDDHDAGAGYSPRSHGDYLPRSPVVGEASPLSPRIDWEVVDGQVHATGTFGAAYEGPPGFVHGGMIALAFDEVLGIANIVAGHPGMTGTLTVRYRQPTPLHRAVRFVARVERAEGRRVVSHAELWAGETLCAEAEGLFVAPRPEQAEAYFGRGPDDAA